MQYVYLISCVFLVSSSSILGGFYNRKTQNEKGVTELYNLLIMLSVFLCWLILFLIKYSFDWKVVPYSILFSICFTICNFGLINALKSGSVALTSLLLQLSLLGVSVWGIIFWDSAFNAFTIVGMLLVVVSLCLCLYNKKNDDKLEINYKWLFFSLLAFIGNAGCSIVQKTQQIAFHGQYGNELMVIASGLSLVFCCIFMLFRRPEKILHIIKSCGVYPTLSGFCNFLLNMFVIFLATSSLSSSLVYPVIAVGGLILTTVFSAFVFREKMNWMQWTGVVVGVVAVGFLSL